MSSTLPRVTLRQDLQRSAFSTTTEGIITLEQVPYTGLGDMLASSAFITFLVIVTGFGGWVVIQRGSFGGLAPAFASAYRTTHAPAVLVRLDPLTGLVGAAITQDVWLPRDALEAVAARANGNIDLAARMLPHCVALARAWYPDACTNGMISSEAIAAVLNAAEQRQESA